MPDSGARIVPNVIRACGSLNPRASTSAQYALSIYAALLPALSTVFQLACPYIEPSSIGFIRERARDDTVPLRKQWIVIRILERNESKY